MLRIQRCLVVWSDGELRLGAPKGSVLGVSGELGKGSVEREPQKSQKHSVVLVELREKETETQEGDKVQEE